MEPGGVISLGPHLRPRLHGQQGLVISTNGRLSAIGGAAVALLNGSCIGARAGNSRADGCAAINAVGKHTQN